VDGEHLGQAFGGDPILSYRGSRDSRPLGVRQLGQPFLRNARRFFLSQKTDRQQRIVELVGVTRIGRGFFPHARDGVRVERAEIA
jgi:hypothetical protein